MIKEPIPPAKIVTPTGIQKDEPAMIIGTTPTAVVAVVKKMGTIRRFPAWYAASFTAALYCSKYFLRSSLCIFPGKGCA